MHTIRLRGPWQYEVQCAYQHSDAGEPFTRHENLPPPGRIQMPADWGATLGDDFRGRVLYRRQFNCPTGLDAGQAVWIALDEVDCAAQVVLNERVLGAFTGRDGGVRFEITRLLQPRNTLDVLVDLPCPPASGGRLPRPPERDDQPGGLVGEVRLEIE